MKKTKIISGFPGVGKSYLHRYNQDLVILDSDSSQFSWISEGVRNPDFPNNYLEHIQSNTGQADIILVSSHKVVRDALTENNVNYILAYPARELKPLYLQRYRDRGNPLSFIEMMDAKWDDFLGEIEAEQIPIKIALQGNQYMTDVISGLRGILQFE